VTDPRAARDAVAAAVETFGRLDVLVNNDGYGDMVPSRIPASTISGSGEMSLVTFRKNDFADA
jgi:NAD(P)-dependent dehydrogenase (short-subunit alcohol dehydrogenase family)